LPFRFIRLEVKEVGFLMLRNKWFMFEIIAEFKELMITLENGRAIIG